MIAETALKKIGELQIDIIHKRQITDKENYLQDTNKLLKEIGSKDRIEAVPRTDVFETIQRFTDNLFTKEEDPNQKTIDTNSFVYFKNLREMNVYKKKLLETELQLIKNALLFRFAQVKRMTLKRKLLLQNIQIIENRISYSQISKGFQYYISLFLGFFYTFGEIALYAIFIFSLVHIFTETLPLGYHMSGGTIKFIIFLALFSLLSRGMRDLVLFFISWIALFFVMYFVSVNF
jgi:hypothetical protein